MPLPLKTTIDLEALTDAQLVALYRIVEESGRVELAGVLQADVEERLHKRVLNFADGFCVPVTDLEAAYNEVNQFVADKVGTAGMSPLA